MCTINFDIAYLWGPIDCIAFDNRLLGRGEHEERIPRDYIGKGNFELDVGLDRYF
jgi:hypothetical protein